MTRRPIHTTSSRRGEHVIDVARRYAALLEPPERLTQAAICRRFGTSRGYVSILARLGRALQSLTSPEVAALRVPAVTFKAVQLAVTTATDATGSVDVPTLHAALRQIAAATRPVRSRRPRTGGTEGWRREIPVYSDEDHLDPIPLLPAQAAEREVQRAQGFTFPWDAAAARRDPEAVLAAYERFIRDTTAQVIVRLRQAAGVRLDVQTGPARGVPDGAPGGLPRARLSGGSAASVPLGLDLSLRQLNANLTATLAANRARMAQFAADSRRGGAPLTALTDVTPEELDADLGEPR